MERSIPNDLFREGESYHLNASIGTNGGPYDYGDYSMGYFAAAFHLIESLAEGDKPGLYLDVCVYPIVANFRHAIELAIKHPIVIAAGIQRVKTDFQTNHDLKRLLECLRRKVDSISQIV